jgi:hypothetical protein
MVVANLVGVWSWRKHLIQEEQEMRVKAEVS